jgi:hypothetical protein
MTAETTLETPEILLSPIPANTFLKITARKPTSFIIINTTGEVVLKGDLTEGENQISVASIPAGSYIFQSGQLREQIIIAH